MGLSWFRDQTRVPCIGRQIFNHWTSREVPRWLLYRVAVGPECPLLRPNASVLGHSDLSPEMGLWPEGSSPREPEGPGQPSRQEGEPDICWGCYVLGVGSGPNTLTPPPTLPLLPLAEPTHSCGPETVTRPFIHSFTHSLTRSFIHPLTSRQREDSKAFCAKGRTEAIH